MLRARARRRSGATARGLLRVSARDDDTIARPPWRAIVMLSLQQLVAWGVLYYAYSVLSALIASDLGVSRRLIAGAFSAALLVSGLLARYVGRALDRFGARVILLAGVVSGALAFASLSFVRNGWGLLIVFALLGATHALALYEPAFRAIVDWVDDGRVRARAWLLLTSIAGFASTTFLPLTARWAERFGWRVTAVLLAAILLAISIPFRLALPPTSHTERDERRSGEAVLTRSRAAEWLGVAFALQAFASTGVVVFLVWHFVERGLPLRSAAALSGLAGAAQVPGRLVLLPLQGVLPTAWRLPTLLVVQSIGLLGIAFTSGAPRLCAIVFFGAAAGMMTIERATVIIEWFGRKTFGTRSGAMASLCAVARALSPFAVEALHGLTSYGRVFAAMSLVMLAAAAVAAAAMRVGTGVAHAALATTLRRT